MAPYAATKGAVKMFTQGLARELGARDITVNNVQPGCLCAKSKIASETRRSDRSGREWCSACLGEAILAEPPTETSFGPKHSDQQT